MSDETHAEVAKVLDQFGDAVARRLDELDLARHLSPFFRPFSLVVLRDSDQLLVGLSPAAAMSQLLWLDRPSDLVALRAVGNLVTQQLGLELAALVSLPLPTDSQRLEKVEAAAAAHAKEVETMNTLEKLGDFQHVRHLEPYLRAFLEDHPEPSRNVFIMMRFGATPQMKQIHDAIVAGLAEHGMNAVRADDRDYTGELWSNIEVYLTGCAYGIAVFEDIEQRDYNPNVSLELGYLMGRGKRTLLLKEKRLPNMPSDVVHRLYKEFDGFDIDNSIKREVGTWITRDLRI
ncbi:hypothetical protein JOF42_000524 [Microbacterium phyllosphaerae]|uniref:CD-NTase-associated protein 12/Pycsar effector protein TIR domain-containing protein n=1 Tax=Microbacterium phyllosphaerae TaxID=124798 RepID=A0ABS4WLD7_9MICO|nr:hypothetical protein [Microbacterium phyllosphaerae]MBP2377029.1 hypothetical protein [Microbacterium phyllosphaerae]